MITQCPECELQVSDKAITCPHCGYPLDKTANIKTKRRCKKKHQRLPNGFGQITELKGRNLRNPYRATVTVGKTPTGKPIVKMLKPVAYFATYNEAYTALVDYNRNPYDLAEDITVKELYERWSKKHYANITEGSAAAIKTAWSYCSAVYDMPVRELRIRHIKGCIEDGIYLYNGEEHHTTPTVKARIKVLFNMLLDYAVEYEIIETNYSRNFQLDEKFTKKIERDRKGHLAFTKDELYTLWDNCRNIDGIDIILIQCYSGWRPQELGLIELKNVDLVNWTFSGGLKTDAGRNRVVPIHKKIKALVKRRYDEAISLNSDYLFNYVSQMKSPDGTRLTYSRYKRLFDKILRTLSLSARHRPHDPRKTFVTIAKNAGVDEYAIKYIVGHEIRDITEKVYTERSIEWLTSEISKIPEY